MGQGATKIGELLRGDNRIKADRLWRSPEARRNFEMETGFSPDSWNTEEYQSKFRDWASRS